MSRGERSDEARGAASDVVVRPEEPADRPAIFAVHAAAFPTHDEAKLVDALRDAGRLTISLVALRGGEIVGHVAFSPVVVEGEEGLGLAPLAVLEDHRRRGIAERLACEGLARCERAGCGYAVVLGDPAYYARFGFEPASKWNLRDEFDGGEAFQALELRAGAIPAGGGLLRYAPEFSPWETKETG